MEVNKVNHAFKARKAISGNDAAGAADRRLGEAIKKHHRKRNEKGGSLPAPSQ